MKGEIINMEEYEIKRFGEITVLEVNPIIEGGYVRICNEDDFINNIIISIEEIRCITLLYDLLGYVCLDTFNNKFCYRDGYLEIENAFGTMIFNRNDVDNLRYYIYKEYIYEQ
ncbi:MAG: hypothetical protein J6K36_02780 [Bacilli bacterium]|nr:hypothetical protein [Bacilli bacterium]